MMQEMLDDCKTAQGSLCFSQMENTALMQMKPKTLTAKKVNFCLENIKI